MKTLEKLYEVIKEQGMFEGFEECESCIVRCSRKQNIHWLLPEETIRLRGFMGAKKISGAYFFNGGLCSLLAEKGCGIYLTRPLECRLNPLSIYEIDSELYWILYTECPVVKNKGTKRFIERLKPGIERVSPFITPELREEFTKISKAIKSFDPLVEGRDFIKVGKL